MRKLAKGPALAAAIISIFGLLGIIVNFVNYLKVPHMPAMSYVTLALGFVSTVLLVVVLFRGKADTFAAVACFAQLPSALLALISAIGSCILPARHLSVAAARTDLITYVLLALFNILKIAAFVMMALQCLRKEARKSTVCTLLPVVAIVLFAVYTVFNLKMTYGRMGLSLGDFFDLPAYAIGQIVGAFIGSILGALPLVFSGIAFGKVTAGEEVSAQQYQAPLYQQYQMPQQPQYQAPQYQAPQYQAPQYQQPQYQAPQYQQPQYQAPQYQQPQYQAPQYQQPVYQAPQYQQPVYQAPQYQQPVYQAPQAPAPEEQPPVVQPNE